jgi:hypothetical protein
MFKSKKGAIAAELIMSLGYAALCAAEYLLLPHTEFWAKAVMNSWALMIVSYFLLLRFRIIYLVLPFVSYCVTKLIILANTHFEENGYLHMLNYGFFKREQMMMSAYFLFVNVLPLSMLTRWLFKQIKQIVAQNRAQKLQQAAAQQPPGQPPQPQTEIVFVPQQPITAVVTLNTVPAGEAAAEQPTAVPPTPRQSEPMSERSHLFRKIGLSLWLHLVCWAAAVIMAVYTPFAYIAFSLCKTRAGTMIYFLMVWGLFNIPLIVGSHKHPFTDRECRIVYHVFSGAFSLILLGRFAHELSLWF